MSNVANLIEQGNDFKKKKEFEKAIECYERIIKLEPKNSDAWYNMGDAFDNLMKFKEAIKSYHNTIKFDQNNAKAWYNMGAVYFDLEKPKKAIKCFKKTVEINPSDSEAWHNLGVISNKLKKHDEAMEYLEKAVEINPNYAEAWYELGNNYKKVKKVKRPIDNTERVNKILKQHEIVPDEFYDFNYYSQLIFKIDCSMECYRKAVEINPQLIDAWQKKSEVHLLLFEFKNLLECYKKIVEIDPHYVNIWYSMGDSYRFIKKYEKALDCYNEVIKVDPTFALAWYQIGKLYKKQGGSNTIAHFDKVLELGLESQSMWEVILDSDTRIAIQDFKILDIFISCKLSLHISAFPMEKILSGIDPIKQIMQALWDDMGGFYFDLNDNDKAIKCYKQVLELESKRMEYLSKYFSPNVPHPDVRVVNAWYKIGRAFEERKEYVDAIECFEKALDINPKYTPSEKALERVLKKIEKEKWKYI